MYFFDYQLDTGKIFERVPAFIQGIDRRNNEFIPPDECLDILGSFIGVSEFKLAGRKESFCKLPSQFRPRRLILEVSNKNVEVTYPKPFFTVPFDPDNLGNAKIETIGERQITFLLTRLI